MRSSYAVEYTHISDIDPVGAPALLLVSPEDFDDEEVRQIETVSSSSRKLRLEKTPADNGSLEIIILDFVKNLPADSNSLEK